MLGRRGPAGDGVVVDRIAGAHGKPADVGAAVLPGAAAHVPLRAGGNAAAGLSSTVRLPASCVYVPVTGVVAPAVMVIAVLTGEAQPATSLKYTSWLPGLRPVTVAPLLCQPPPAPPFPLPRSILRRRYSRPPARGSPARCRSAPGRAPSTEEARRRTARSSSSWPLDNPLNGRLRGAHWRNSVVIIPAYCPRGRLRQFKAGSFNSLPLHCSLYKGVARDYLKHALDKGAQVRMSHFKGDLRPSF